MSCIGGEGDCLTGRDKICSGGPLLGEICHLDSDCRGFCDPANRRCDGPPFDGQPCVTDSHCDPNGPMLPNSQCQNYCNGGVNDGLICFTDHYCNNDGACVALFEPVCSFDALNSGEICATDADCVGGFCVHRRCDGGPNDSEPCETLRDCAGIICQGFPGCADPTCCTAVCDTFDPFCCDEHWDPVCALSAQSLNEECGTEPGMINECLAGVDDCHANATCIDLLDGFDCICNPGYEGDGVACDDIDECASGIHNCDANARCTNTEGSFECLCNAGYEGDGFSCVPIPCFGDIGEFRCSGNGVCLTPNQCRCEVGWIGAQCEIRVRIRPFAEDELRPDSNPD